MTDLLVLPKELNMDGFVVDKLIDKGSFGKVYLIKKENILSITTPGVTIQRILKIALIEKEFLDECKIELVSKLKWGR